jgi:heterodisulfide reductase subunit B
MKYALFMGCTIPARGRNYEMSARQVAARLGIELVDINDFSCCGFPIKGVEYDLAQAMVARNLALAEEAGLPICSLCSACTAMLTEVAHELAEDPALLERVNVHLAKIGRQYRGTTKIKHFTRILFEDIGVEELRKHVQVDIGLFSFAPHYGCHYLKPSAVYGGFDEVEAPESIGALIEAAGAREADLGNRKHCCGGAVMAVNQSVTFEMAARKLTHVRESGADAMCLICPFCAVVYDDNQRSIQAAVGAEFEIPVLYYPQILGLAMGIPPKALGLNLNKVKTKALLARLKEASSHA